MLPAPAQALLSLPHAGAEVTVCKQGPRTAKDKVPAQEKLQPGLGSFLQGCYKELNIHSFEAAFGQGTDSLDSYKAAPAKGAAEAAQEERSLSAA